MKDLNLTVSGPMLSDYWSGHHNPAICVPVVGGEKLREFLELVVDEYHNTYDHLEYCALWQDIEDSDLRENVLAMFISPSLDQRLFSDIEPCGCDDGDEGVCEGCYVYVMINE